GDRHKIGPSRKTARNADIHTFGGSNDLSNFVAYGSRRGSAIACSGKRGDNIGGSNRARRESRPDQVYICDAGYTSAWCGQAGQFNLTKRELSRKEAYDDR